MERYSRQLGLVDQEKIRGKKIGIFGLGGLGNVCLAYLSAAGVKNFVLVDKDFVEESNLNRQILFSPKDLGRRKVDVAEKWLKRFDPEAKVVKFFEINEEAVKSCDIVIDALDNWESRKKLWHLAFKNGKVVVHGAADEWYGQVAVLISREDAQKIFGRGEGCRIVGAVAGVIGSLMALETIKLINSIPSSSYFLSFDGKELRRFKIKGERWNIIKATPDELWIKSSLSRRKLMRILLRDLKGRIKGKVYAEGAHVFIEPYSKEDFEKVLKTPGIKVVCPAFKLRHGELKRKVVEIAREEVLEKFRITAKRVWKGYGKTSLEIQRELGEVVKNEVGKEVDLKFYDTEIFVEIHKDFALVYTKRFKGVGGLPYGSQGKVVLLFSGGIDSPVAAYMLGKRGIEIYPLFLDPTCGIVKAKVFKVFEKLKEFFPSLTLYSIDVCDEVDEIRDKIKEGLRQVVLKRFMYRIANLFAKDVGALAIATGESIGQTSSQTLKNLAVIERASELPVLRPLAGMDKEEIVKIAKLIGTFEMSSEIKEFCSIERHSKVDVSLEEIEKEEEKLELDYEKILEKLEVVTSPKDFREEFDIKGDFVVVKLWEENFDFEKADKSKKYIFVCKSGYNAKLMSIKAREHGFEAFSLSYKEAKEKGLV